MDTLFYFQEPDPPVTGYGILFGFEVLHYRAKDYLPEDLIQPGKYDSKNNLKIK